MVAAAREVGVDDDALDEALASLDDEVRPPAPRPAEGGFLNKERREAFYAFFRHLLIYIVVNGAIWFGLNQPHWQRWMLIFWGLGLAIQLVNVLMPDREEKKKKDRKKKKAERERKGRRKGKDRRAEGDGFDGAKLEHAVSHFIETATRLRFEENKSLGDALLKAAKETGQEMGREAEAVEEAQAAEEAEAAERRRRAR